VHPWPADRNVCFAQESFGCQLAAAERRARIAEEALRQIELHINSHLGWFAAVTNDDAYYQAMTEPGQIARKALAEADVIGEEVSRS